MGFDGIPAARQSRPRPDDGRGARRWPSAGRAVEMLLGAAKDGEPGAFAGRPGPPRRRREHAPDPAGGAASPPSHRAARSSPGARPVDERHRSDPAIELVDVTKHYGDAVALDHLSLRIDSGEFFCLLGPSGCGKTTTLNLIGGFIPLTSGELRIEGHVVNDLPPHKRNVNTVFQNYALFPHMSVAENVAFGLRMEGLDARSIADRVDEYLALVGLATYHDRHPGQLSGWPGAARSRSRARSPSAPPSSCSTSRSARST
jgi:ABC-type glutathione transport system ATPase component